MCEKKWETKEGIISSDGLSPDRFQLTTEFRTHWVSTVKLSPIFTPPNTYNPYETMVFKYGEWTQLDEASYTTEEEARTGHELMCEKWYKELGNPDEVTPAS